MADEYVNYVELSRERLRTYVPKSLDAPQAMPAAVLILITEHAGEHCVVLTVRSYDVEHHKGEISFPGGAVHDADDSRATTALRETWEEVGVHPDDVEVIGEIDEMITISNFVVRPIVGVLKKTPYEFVPAVDEVAEIIQPSLAHLLDPANMLMEEREVRGMRVRLPTYVWGEHKVWGATARMLSNFLSVLQAGD